MKKTLTLIAALAALALTPQSLLADTNPNGMYERLQGSDKPFGGKVKPGSGCAGCSAGCGSSARKSSAEIQMSVIMPMIFKLDLTAEQKSAIQKQIDTLKPAAGDDPKLLDTQRVKIMRASVAVLTPIQRKTLIEQLTQR